MNKSVKRIICIGLSAITVLPLTACKSCKKGKNYTYDPETRPVVFATEALDGNFNPFFSTSATDSNIASMTQVGMLVTDDKGAITFGENQPTVALDYKYTVAAGDAYTDYEFIIKNGIKFSDGTDLTIKDVLFNIYVYLDPAYTGSATMYSTDIVGLQAYRYQDPDLQDSASAEGLDASFEAKADARILNMLSYLDGDTSSTAQIAKDVEVVKTLFKDEAESDWTVHQGTQESYVNEYTLTEDWEIYYLNEGIAKIITRNGKLVKDDNGKYITTLTKPESVNYNGAPYTGNIAGASDVYAEHLVDEIMGSLTPEAIAAYTSTGASEEDAKAFVLRDFAIKTVHETYTSYDDMLAQVMRYWATAGNVREQFIAEARTEHFNNQFAEAGGMAVQTISGITTAKTSTDFQGNALDGEHDVLKIRINGVDPKAEYNFSFAVAPMNYYSGTYEGVDYAAQADGVTSFGVKFNDHNFFEDVLQADEKNKKPVGAGAYQASNLNGDVINVNGNDFFSNNWVYFARNDYFDTVGGDEIQNAKIKYLRYRVVSSDTLLQALEAQNIDVGEPNATATNISKIGEIEHLSQKTVPVNGYGYVGVNPKYVRDLHVRRAIMMAMDPAYCIAYYTEANAEIIYRSMSSQSWIWDYADGGKPTSYYNLEMAMAVADIQNEVLLDGWEYDPTLKKLVKDGKTLKYTFTIAGGTTDHPAYQMFSEAALLLNSAGFDITVATDVNALKKLATGQLAVWAAAWSSTVDPDMYQVYHKDSTATSVNNWGYPTILADQSGDFDEEKATINQLSDLIEKARKTNDKETRAKDYFKALELVQDLAVELPTYQRNDCVAYNKNVINPDSLNQYPTAFAGVINEIWELDYN